MSANFPHIFFGFLITSSVSFDLYYDVFLALILILEASLRSYNLKPGTMVEWGNYWARAIQMRDYANQEAFLGMFSQVGDLYNVKHIWCYDSLQDRQKARVQLSLATQLRN